jgi:hypothetical protein
MTGYSTDRFRVAPALAACAFPGLGHIVLGHVRRGLLIAAGVLGLFFGGLLIGGLSVIDRQAAPIWFIAQALNGPIAFAADWVHQSQFKLPAVGAQPARPFLPNEAFDPATGRLITDAQARGLKPPLVKSLGRVNEIGILYIAIGGMLNLIAIIDAAFNTPKTREDRAIAEARKRMQPAPSTGGGASR